LNRLFGHIGHLRLPGRESLELRIVDIIPGYVKKLIPHCREAFISQGDRLQIPVVISGEDECV